MAAMRYDYLIVGAGMFGAAFARELTDSGAHCLVIDKRPHIAGNCYTKNFQNIQVHSYGPHIFHTNDEAVWSYVNRFTKFNSYVNRPKVRFGDSIYSFPINLFTLYQLWGVKTPTEAERKLSEVRVKIDKPSNLEEWILSQVGEEIYTKFIYGYTKKQWGRSPRDLPASIIKRLPIRLSFDDNYFTDRFQGIPENGYTSLFEKLLDGIEIQLGTDFLRDKEYLEKISSKVVYTGALDELFDYDLGELEWRSLDFMHEVVDVSDYQGNAIINYTDESVPYTRICEHKHFYSLQSNSTVVTREYSVVWERGREKYYPINDTRNNELQLAYAKRVDPARYVVGGRLADYRYYDMHQVLASALARSRREIEKRS